MATKLKLIQKNFDTANDWMDVPEAPAYFNSHDEAREWLLANGYPEESFHHFRLI